MSDLFIITNIFVLLQCRRCRVNPWVGKIPWRRKWHPTQVFSPGKPHGQRSLEGYSLWGCKESDTTYWLNNKPSERVQMASEFRLKTREPWYLILHIFPGDAALGLYGDHGGWQHASIPSIRRSLFHEAKSGCCNEWKPADITLLINTAVFRW